MSDLVCSCFRLRRAARRVTNAYDRALAPIGITAVQFTVLAEIARNSGLSVAALGDRLATERTAMSRVVKPLLQAGLVEDGPGDDARARHLRLTEMGLERLHAGSKAWLKVEGRLTRLLGVSERDTLWAMLSATEDAMEAIETPSSA